MLAHNPPRESYRARAPPLCSLPLPERVSHHGDVHFHRNVQWLTELRDAVDRRGLPDHPIEGAVSRAALVLGVTLSLVLRIRLRLLSLHQEARQRRLRQGYPPATPPQKLLAHTQQAADGIMRCAKA